MLAVLFSLDTSSSAMISLFCGIVFHPDPSVSRTPSMMRNSYARYVDTRSPFHCHFRTNNTHIDFVTCTWKPMYDLTFYFLRNFRLLPDASQTRSKTKTFQRSRSSNVREQLKRSNAFSTIIYLTRVSGSRVNRSAKSDRPIREPNSSDSN